MSLTSGVRESWPVWGLLLLPWASLFPFPVSLPGFLFICVQTHPLIHILTQKKCFICYSDILIAIEYICLFRLYPKNMRHLQQGRFSFKINSCRTLVIFLLTGQFVFLQIPHPLEDTCCQEEMRVNPGCPGQLAALLWAQSVSKGEAKALPILFRKAHRVVSCHKLPNPGTTLKCAGVSLSILPVVSFLRSVCWGE